MWNRAPVLCNILGPQNGFLKRHYHTFVVYGLEIEICQFVPLTFNLNLIPHSDLPETVLVFGRDFPRQQTFIICSQNNASGLVLTHFHCYFQ